MIVGNPEIFAIESVITEGLSPVSQRGLGYFVLHVSGSIYGVREPDASLLACSFDEVQDRIRRRGKHCMDALSQEPALFVAKTYIDAIFCDPRSELYCGQSHGEFVRALYAAKIQWAPDGDEAFDDGSFVLQFDVDDNVRIVAFKVGELLPEPAWTSEVWVGEAEFYGMLTEWRDQFLTEWSTSLLRQS